MSCKQLSLKYTKIEWGFQKVMAFSGPTRFLEKFVEVA